MYICNTKLYVNNRDIHLHVVHLLNNLSAMKSLHIIFFLLIVCPTVGQTSYYKQISIVYNNKKVKGDNTGQFVTLTTKGCYDSNKKGFTVNNGFLAYQGTRKNIHVYRGNSFWGNAYYCFNIDYTRLNIKITDSGITYVYIKTDIPENTITCSKIKPKEAPDNTQHNIIIQQQNFPENYSKIPEKLKHEPKKVKCSLCKGTGVSPMCDYPADYTGGSVVTIRYCSVCNKTNKYHSHGMCPSCQGKGYCLRSF